MERSQEIEGGGGGGKYGGGESTYSDKSLGTFPLLSTLRTTNISISGHVNKIPCFSSPPASIF